MRSCVAYTACRVEAAAVARCRRVVMTWKWAWCTIALCAVARDERWRTAVRAGVRWCVVDDCLTGSKRTARRTSWPRTGKWRTTRQRRTGGEKRPRTRKRRTARRRTAKRRTATRRTGPRKATRRTGPRTARRTGSRTARRTGRACCGHLRRARPTWAVRRRTRRRSMRQRRARRMIPTTHGKKNTKCHRALSNVTVNFFFSHKNHLYTVMFFIFCLDY